MTITLEEIKKELKDFHLLYLRRENAFKTIEEQIETLKKQGDLLKAIINGELRHMQTERILFNEIEELDIINPTSAESLALIKKYKDFIENNPKELVEQRNEQYRTTLAELSKIGWKLTEMTDLTKPELDVDGGP